VGASGAIRGAADTSLQADGIDDRVVAGSISMLTPGSWPRFTLEVWVFLTRLHREQHIVEFAEANGDKAPALLYDDPTWKFK
jgi:hypothetical protein